MKKKKRNGIRELVKASKGAAVGPTSQVLVSESLFQGWDATALDWLYSSELSPEESLWKTIIISAVHDCLHPVPQQSGIAKKALREANRRALQSDAIEYIFFREFEHDFLFACSCLSEDPYALRDRIRTFVELELQKPQPERRRIYDTHTCYKKITIKVHA